VKKETNSSSVTSRQLQAHKKNRTHTCGSGSEIRSELEVELARKLQLPGIACAGDLTRTARVTARERGPGCRRRQTDIYICPLRVVEDVERLEPQLKTGVFCEVEVLEQGHVEVENSWAVDRVAVEVTEAARRWLREDSRVVPHRILPRRLAVTGLDSDLTSDVVRTDMAEASIPQVSV
jgi:hypothetical protein